MTALSLIGDDGGLRLRNPSLFAVIERRFEPLRIAFGRTFLPGQRLRVRFRAAFPERLAADQEPLLSSGTVRRYDALWLRQPGPGRWRLALAPAADAPQLSEEFVLPPNRFHAFDVDLDRLSAAARGKNQRHPGGGDQQRSGARDREDAVARQRPSRPGSPELGQFSGTLLSERFLAAGTPGLAVAPAISTRPAIYSGAGDPPPAHPQLGQLWVRADKDGAYLFCESGWRWIPRHALDRVVIERLLPPWGSGAGAVEPVAFSGAPAAGDAVFLRHLRGGGCAFGVARWDGRRWSLGPTGSAQPASRRSRRARHPGSARGARARGARRRRGAALDRRAGPDPARGPASGSADGRGLPPSPQTRSRGKCPTAIPRSGPRRPLWCRALPRPAGLGCRRGRGLPLDVDAAVRERRHEGADRRHDGRGQRTDDTHRQRELRYHPIPLPDDHSAHVALVDQPLQLQLRPTCGAPSARN